MSEQLHPGLHPDPDSLSSFVEGALPEHERLQCLAHLAECSHCREVVFLAQEPRPAPAASNPALAWRRWFAPVPVLSAAAAAFIVVLAVSLYLHHKAGTPTRELGARVRQTPPPSAPDIGTEAQTPRSIAPKVRPNPRPRTKPEPDRAAQATALPTNRRAFSTTARTITPPILSSPPPIPAPSDTIQNQQLSLPPALLSSIPPPPRFPNVDSKDEGLSGISGAVTDVTGAAIPGAAIRLRQLAGPINSDVRTDITGRFKLAGLPAGRYELQITAPGFSQTSRQIDLRPREVATVRSELAIGSVTETVEVTSSVPSIQTESASMSRKSRRKPASPEEPRPLPSKLPATTTVTSGKVMLAVDSAGAVFVSRNSGRRWKAVKPVWRGKVVSLVTMAEPSQTSAFQITTDTDSTWLSRDGSHWYRALSGR